MTPDSGKDCPSLAFRPVDYQQLPARERTRENLLPAEIVLSLIRYSGLELSVAAETLLLSRWLSFSEVTFGQR